MHFSATWGCLPRSTRPCRWTRKQLAHVGAPWGCLELRRAHAAGAGQRLSPPARKSPLIPSEVVLPCTLRWLLSPHSLAAPASSPARLLPPSPHGSSSRGHPTPSSTCRVPPCGPGWGPSSDIGVPSDCERFASVRLFCLDPRFIGYFCDHEPAAAPGAQPNAQRAAVEPPLPAPAPDAQGAQQVAVAPPPPAPAPDAQGAQQAAVAPPPPNVAYGPPRPSQ